MRRGRARLYLFVLALLFVSPVPSAFAGIDPGALDEVFWRTDATDEKRLEASLFPESRAERDGPWNALVLHHVATINGKRTGSWAEAAERECHVIVGLDRHVKISPRWFAGARTMHALNPAAHAAVAVCIEGDLDRRIPDAEQLKVYARVVRVLARGLHIPVDSIYTHRELDGRATVCPGRHLDKLHVLEMAGLLPSAGAAEIVVEKHARKLTLVRGGHTLLRIDVAAEAVRDVPAIPPGQFRVCRRDEGTAFNYYLGLCAKGEHPPREEAGGTFGIHGGGDAFHFDWTLGCFALADRDVEELYRSTRVGTPVEVRP